MVDSSCKRIGLVSAKEFGCCSYELHARQKEQACDGVQKIEINVSAVATFFNMLVNNDHLLVAFA